jgi:hypothetical protein
VDTKDTEIQVQYYVCFPISLADKVEASAQLKDLVSGLSSQFVSSPPALRTKRKNTSTSRLVDELVRKA